MKRAFSLVLVCALALCLCACGAGNTASTTPATSASKKPVTIRSRDVPTTVQNAVSPIKRHNARATSQGYGKGNNSVRLAR